MKYFLVKSRISRNLYFSWLRPRCSVVRVESFAVARWKHLSIALTLWNSQPFNPECQKQSASMAAIKNFACQVAEFLKVDRILWSWWKPGTCSGSMSVVSFVPWSWQVWCCYYSSSSLFGLGMLTSLRFEEMLLTWLRNLSKLSMLVCLVSTSSSISEGLSGWVCSLPEAFLPIFKAGASYLRWSIWAISCCWSNSSPSVCVLFLLSIPSC